MLSARGGSPHSFAFLLWATGICLLGSAPVWAQAASGVGSGTNPEHDTRREPYQIKLSGFIFMDPPPANDQSLGVVTLGFSIYRGTRLFEVVSLNSPDYPQLSPKTILRQAGRGKMHLRLTGPKGLLSRVAQSQPGTPLKIVGVFYPRKRDLRLIRVEEMGFEGRY